jgi:hypothetical protein
MVLTARQYANAVVYNEAAWVNPNNILGVEDVVCTTKTVTGMAGADLYIGFPTFGLPANAVISAARIGLKGVWFSKIPSSEGNYLIFFLYDNSYHYVGQVSVPKVGNSSACSESAYYVGTIASLYLPYLTVALLNGGSWNEAFLEAYCSVVGDKTYNSADSVYLEVDYTVPAAGATVGDGLTWITAMKKFKDLAKPRFPSVPLTRRRLLKKWLTPKQT